MEQSPDEQEPTREYPAVGPPAAEPPAPEPAAAEPRPGIGGFARLLIFTGVVFGLIVASCLGLRALNVLPSFDNPFADKQTDRSQPVLLQSMRDLSRYVAADGTFQVIVDLQQSKENVPEFLLNRRTLFVGSGTVEEYVDFGSLTEGAITVNNNDNSVQIKLPAPQQSTACRMSASSSGSFTRRIWKRSASTAMRGPSPKPIATCDETTDASSPT